MEIPVALVTGANKGIGLQIVRELCKKFRGTVYLTGRDASRGKEAVEKLEHEGLTPEFLQMDVTDLNSIKNVAKYLKTEHGGLDILVNNAGVLMHSSSPEEFEKEAETTFAINFFGLLDVCEQLFPLLRSHARVVNLSSTLGNLSYLKNRKVKERVIADDLTVAELKGIMNDYLTAVKNRNYDELGYHGFPAAYGSYPMSKIGVTALTRIQQRVFDQDKSREDIVVNAVHPGYVNTDMTQGKGNLTVEQGAQTPLFAALLEKGGKDIPRGRHLSNQKIVDWIHS